MKKLICLLLVACFMVAALVSCAGAGEEGSGSEGGSDGANGGANGGAATTVKVTNEFGEESFSSVVPVGELDFEGKTLTILHRDSLPVQREWYKDEDDGEKDDLDEAIAMRNEMIASELNIEVQYIPMASSRYEDCVSQFSEAIASDVTGGMHTYDIVANYAAAGALDSLRDYFANMADKDLFPYFEFSLPCWNQAIVKTTKVNDKLFYITGDLNLSTFDKTMVVFLNKKVYNDMKQSGDPDDLQDLALEGYDVAAKKGKAGGFTYDDLYAWSTRVKEDNGTDGYQHDDIHGISADFSSIPLDALPYAWDLDYLVENADKSHSYNIVGNNKIEEAIGKAQALLNGQISSGVCNDDRTGGCELGGYSEPITHFAKDKSVFALHILYCTEDDNNMMRTMESEYGLLPMPKYDKDQIDYGTTAHDAYTLMTVLNHTQGEPTDGKMVSAYLQLSTEESYTNVRGYYINRIVKPKYFGTSESVSKSVDIFNIIADNVEFTFISVYAPQLNNVLNTCWREVVNGEHSSGATTAADAYAADQSNFDGKLDAVDQWLGLK